jgi:hypothetical protein
MMRDAVEKVCDQHADRFNCPDYLMTYVPEYREYGIIIHDGGSAYSVIKHCPWWGARLPESLR